MKKVRKTRNIYEEFLTKPNLYKSFEEVRKSGKNKEEIYKFQMNLNININDIYSSLLNRNYTFDKYSTFMILDPKARLIMNQSIKDKVVSRFITDYLLIPFIEPRLIDSNVASRKEKGGSYAYKLINSYINSYLENGIYDIYCLKLDISNYFYSIDHELLLNMLKKHIMDEDVIELLNKYINLTDESYINESIDALNKKNKSEVVNYKTGKGLSIGSSVSQFLAIYYLNDLDHYIKEVLKCKHYIRYMDDFILLSDSKEQVELWYKKIIKALDVLKLKTNDKTIICNLKQGITFLGYSYKIEDNKLKIGLKQKTYEKMIDKLTNLKKTDKMKYYKSLASYNGYFKDVLKTKKDLFKLKNSDIYKFYKEKYNDLLVIVKEKEYYKTYEYDAIIISEKINFKLSKDMLFFGVRSYDKVINKLKQLNIGFLIIEKREEALKYIPEDNCYLEVINEIKEKIRIENKKKYIHNKLTSILNKDFNKYKTILRMLNLIDKQK